MTKQEKFEVIEEFVQYFCDDLCRRISDKDESLCLGSQVMHVLIPAVGDALNKYKAEAQ